MKDFRVVLVCSVLLCAGPASGQDSTTPPFETRVRDLVTACADVVAGAPVAEAFGALPLSQPRVLRRSIFALAAPELVEWFGPDASVRDQSFAHSAGNAFVYVDESGSRCRVQAFTYDRSAIGDVARQALQARDRVWRQSSADTWSTDIGSTARVQAIELMTGGSEVIAEVVRARASSPSPP